MSYSAIRDENLGSLNYFLGLEFSYVPTSYNLSSVKCKYDLLLKSGINDTKIASTPLENEVKLNVEDGALLTNPTLHLQLGRSLIYLKFTRLDITHFFHIVIQFMAAPPTPHYTVVPHILSYFKGIIFHVLHYSLNCPPELHAYSDVEPMCNFTSFTHDK